MSFSAGNHNQKVYIDYVPEEGNIAGLYRCDFIQFNTNASTNWQTFTKSWPMDVKILLTEYVANAVIEDGDLATCLFDFGVVGAITSDIAIGDGNTEGKEIHITPASMQYMEVGYNFILDDGTNIDDLGLIVKKDINNNQILCENSTTYAFAASTPTTVKIIRYLVKDLPLEAGRSYDFGRVWIGDTIFPSGREITLMIKSCSIIPKKGVLKLEILY